MASPKVAGIYIRATAWVANYMTSLESVGVGKAGLGWRLPDGASQGVLAGMAVWPYLDTIVVEFDSAVASSTITTANLVLYRHPGVVVPSLTVAYDDVNYRGTWTFAALARGRYALVLSSIIANSGGEYIDGEWVLGQSYPSGGHGTVGLPLVFNFDVSPGDVNRDGICSAADRAAIVANYNQAIDVSTYVYDMTGGNTITSSDSAIVSGLIPTYTAYGNLMDVPLARALP